MTASTRTLVLLLVILAMLVVSLLCHSKPRVGTTKQASLSVTNSGVAVSTSTGIDYALWAQIIATVAGAIEAIFRLLTRTTSSGAIKDVATNETPPDIPQPSR